MDSSAAATHDETTVEDNNFRRRCTLAFILCGLVFIYSSLAHFQTATTFMPLFVTDERLLPALRPKPPADGTNLYNICSPSYQPKIQIGVHHKTGTHLMREFSPIIKSFHLWKCNVSNKKWKSPMQLNRNSNQAWLNKIIASKHDPLPIVVHVIRNPVDTVLSSYNYHNRLSTEPVTYKHMYNNEQQFIKRNRDKTSKNYCYHHAVFDNASVLHIEPAMYATYTIKSLLNNYWNLSLGLLYEYQRFVCYEWPSMNAVHQMMSNLSNAIGVEVTLEAFTADFDQTWSRILDAMGIYDDVDRDWFMRKLRKIDVNRADRQHPQNKLMRDHITQGMYDKKEQLDALLARNRSRCLHFKQIVFSLNCSWLEYSDYC